MSRKKFIFFISMLFIGILGSHAIDLNVGETTVLDAGQIQCLEKCEWRISRPDVVQFVSAPESNATSVTVKAVKLLDGAPCTVECTYYYYKDINPRNGEHMFIRHATKRWEITPTVATYALID